MGTKGEAGNELGDWIDSYTLLILYIKQVTNENLLYSTGNSTQYPGINHNGKEYEKECIYMYN